MNPSNDTDTVDGHCTLWSVAACSWVCGGDCYLCVKQSLEIVSFALDNEIYHLFLVEFNVFTRKWNGTADVPGLNIL